MAVCARSSNLNCASPTYRPPSKPDSYPLNSDRRRPAGGEPLPYVIAQACVDVMGRVLDEFPVPLDALFPPNG